MDTTQTDIKVGQYYREVSGCLYKIISIINGEYRCKVIEADKYGYPAGYVHIWCYEQIKLDKLMKSYSTKLWQLLNED